ncbi:MAG: response regulator transcription factor [Myxococcota bacterium]
MKEKILVVDDDPTILQATLDLLRDEGYEVQGARNGREALGALLGEPDLILMDLMMPVMDGQELLRTVRECERYQGTPLIVMSAGVHLAAMAAVYGATWLQKPFGMEGLLAAVTSSLQPAAS